MTSSYNPLLVNSGLDQFDRNIQTQKSSIQAADQAAERDRATRLRNLMQANQQSQRTVSELAGFSKTLTDLTVDLKDKANKKQMAQGLWDAMTNGDRTAAIGRVDAAETELEQQSIESSKLANRIEEADGNSLTARQLRNTDPWYQYGQFVGGLQKAGNELPLLIREAKQVLPVSIPGPDGKPRLVYYDDIKTEEEYIAWQQEFTSEFLSQFPNLNPDLAQKYLAKPLTQALRTNATEWTQNRDKVEKQQRKDIALDNFVSAIGTEQMAQAYLSLVQNPDISRNEIGTLLNGLVDSKTLTESSLQQLKDHEFIHRGTNQRTTIGKAFARDFDQLSQRVLNVGNREYQQKLTDRRRAMDSEKINFETEMESRDAAFTQGEAIAYKEGLRDKYRSLGLTSSDLSWIDSYITRADESKRKADNDRVIQLYQARGGRIVMSDLRGVHPEVFRTWAPQAKEYESKATPSKQDIDSAEGFIEAELKALYYTEDGTAVRPNRAPEAFRVRETANKRYLEYYAQNIATGAFTPEQAHNAALARVKDNIIAGKYKEESPVGLTSPRTGRDLQDGLLDLKDNPDAWKTRPLAGSNNAMQELVAFQAGKTNRIPLYFQQIAATMPNVSTWDVADAQLKAATGKGLNPPVSETNVRNQSPFVQRLLNHRPTPSRSYQAAISTGDTKWFLDSIASVESKSYGEYDAYNLGGSNNGYTAHGSGNSAKDNRYGKPISQMTLSELMRHQKQDMWAAGRYQFIPGTLKEVYARLENKGLVGPDTVFDAATQDLFALERARQRIGWPGQNTVQGLINEWRGLKYQDPETLSRMLELINKEPMLNPDNLMPGIAN